MKITFEEKKYMKSFILIHGSWHGAWNWHRVIPILEKSGHQAIAIDLPGMGRDKTPVEQVTLNDSVEKVCQLLDTVEGKAILLGHSKNGIVISQVAEYQPHKIEKLVYLAAYLIPDGKCQREYSILDTGGVLKPYVVPDEGLKTTTLRKEIYREGLYEDCGEEITALANVLLSAEPIASAVTPLHLTEKNFGSVRRVYIECLQDKAVTPFIQQKMYTDMPCEKVYSLNTSHSPFFSQPQALADILMEL
jgi:pimeloyl-ACP methyl ester carboxylesterase